MNLTLKVAKIKSETVDTVTICFKQPGLKKVKYQPGQYLTVIFRINGRRYMRPYSFSSCPGVDDLLEITVKRVSKGIVSNHIIDTLKEGDTVEVMEPMGDFIFSNEYDYRQVFLWGAGSGITPLFSIAKYILHYQPDVKVHLAYGNRNLDSTIFYTQIEELKLQFRDRFIVKYFHTEFFVNPSNINIVEGRIKLEDVNSIVSTESEVGRTAHFVCGPTGLKDSVRKALVALQVDLDHFFSEDFELVKNPEEFEDITTQVVEISFKSNRFDLEVVKGKSILEAALDANIELPYSCQTGSCSTCLGRLVKGEVKMIGLAKQREDLLVNEYLLCCAYPLGNNVSIEV